MTGMSNWKADLNYYSTFINHRIDCCCFQVLFGKAIEIYLKYQASGTKFTSIA